MPRPPSSRRGPPERPPGGLYGINPVEEALRQGRRTLHRLYFREGRPSRRLDALRHLAAARGVPVSEEPGARLEHRCGSAQHQGAVLACGPLPVGDEHDALARARRPGALVLALDQVTDPQNLGAALRNAAVFGLDGAVVPRRHSAPLSAAASKASAGRMEALPVDEVANLPRFLEACRRAGVWVAGTAAGSETALPDFRPPRPLVVVMGSEEKGLRPLVAARCDYRVAIPAPGGGSLNVASASAVVLYHLALAGR